MRTLSSTIGWDARLATVAGKHAGTIEKAFGYRTVGELLHHYPRRWVDKGSLSDLGSIEPDEHVTVIARVVAAQLHPYSDRRRGGTAYRLEVRVATTDAELLLTFFDKKRHLAEWRQRRLGPGRTGLFSGKVGTFRNRLQLTNPQTQVFGDDEDADAAAAEWERMPQLIALYPATSSVQSWQIAAAIKVALELVHEVPDVLPDDVRADRGLVSTRQALEGLHRPDSWAEKETAAARLRFDEAFITQTVLAQRRAALRAMEARPRAGRAGGLPDRFDLRL